ncbi:hypothetical protein [Caballeronia sp. AZ10_KS36]|uniref:hypothetical protein n=1 Tax=Caballeronia sp. AZ10_KS36 TaxID=2921757 RepID=UPI0020282B5C|nr:hypothetical protein [Caballeronia sp. AZ10_KS36]
MNKSFTYFLLLILMWGSNSIMAHDKSFSIVTNGSASSEAISEAKITGERFELVMRGDTRDANMPGIGVFRGYLDPSDDGLLSELSDVDMSHGPVPFFRVEKLLQRMYEKGEKVEKLDVSVNVTAERNALMISLAFRNSGESSISFPSPASWKGSFNPIMQHSWILVTGVAADKAASGEHDHTFTTPWFGGAELVNRSDFGNDIVELLPGQIKEARFLVEPSNAFEKGRYKIGVSICIEQIFPPSKLAGGPVEFISQRSVVDFPEASPAGANRR